MSLQSKIKTTSEKMAVFKNQKIILGVTALLILVVVIFLFSFIPYTISTERLKEMTFVTDLLMVCVITILAMVGTIFIGQASNAQNPASKLARATVKFNASKVEVEAKGISFFNQWIEQVLQVKDILLVKKRRLAYMGIDDERVLDLDINQIRSLTVAQKFNNQFYQPLSEEQIEELIKLKTKGVNLKFVPPAYYLSVKSIGDKRTTSERASSEGTKKTLTLLVSIGSKLALTVATSIIFALFVKDLASGEVSTAEVVSKLFNRLLAFFTSVFMGYLVGCQINDIDAEYIDMRVETHREFLEDDKFVGKNSDELGKDAFIERVKEEQVLKLDNKSNQIEMKSEV